MSSDKGFVAIYRDIFEHWVWRDKPFSKGQAWIDLILSANHEDKKIEFDGKIITIEKGSFLTSERKLAARWGWSRGKVLRFLKCLKDDQMLNENRSGRGSIITIGKYSIYQDLRSTKRASDGPLTSHSRASDGPKQPRITKKNQETNKNHRAPAARKAPLRPEDERGEPLPDNWFDEVD